MGIVYYVCEDCEKELGFLIRDDDITGEHLAKIKGNCCNNMPGFGK